MANSKDLLLQQQDIDTYINYLEEFLEDPNSNYLPDYYIKYRIPWTRFWHLRKIDERLDNYYHHARFVLASRNHKKLLSGEKIPIHEAQTYAYLMKSYDRDIFIQEQEAKKEIAMSTFSPAEYESIAKNCLKEKLTGKNKEIYLANKAKSDAATKAKSALSEKKNNKA